MLKFLKQKIRDFRRSQAGTLSVEAVLAFPMLFWAATAMFTFFDAFKAQNATYRANYTISDMLSRETEAIDAAYLQGLYNVYRYMTHANSSTSWIRVSVVECMDLCDQPGRVLEFEWSNSVNGARSLTNTDFAFYNDLIPLLPKGDRLILVETSMDYVPPFPSALVSFGKRKLVSHVVTRPRFAPQLLWTG